MKTSGGIGVVAGNSVIARDVNRPNTITSKLVENVDTVVYFSSKRRMLIRKISLQTKDEEYIQL